MRKLLTICCAAAVLLLGSTEGYAYKASDLEKLKLTGSCPNCELQGADLQEADLRGADLRGANLWKANLREANLGGADLRGANLLYANLRGAKLDSVGLAIARATGAIGLDPSGSDVAKAVPEKPKPAKRIAKAPPPTKPSLPTAKPRDTTPQTMERSIFQMLCQSYNRL